MRDEAVLTREVKDLVLAFGAPAQLELQQRSEPVKAALGKIGARAGDDIRAIQIGGLVIEPIPAA